MGERNGFGQVFVLAQEGQKPCLSAIAVKDSAFRDWISRSVGDRAGAQGLGRLLAFGDLLGFLAEERVMSAWSDPREEELRLGVKSAAEAAEALEALFVPMFGQKNVRRIDPWEGSAPEEGAFTGKSAQKIEALRVWAQEPDGAKARSGKKPKA